MVETYFTIKVVMSLATVSIMAVVLAVCAVKKLVEVIALACKKKRKKKG